MAGVDFGNCEKPDELIQLAWNAGLDKKLVIRAGVDAAGLLLAARNEFATLFWPTPRPLEAVDRWAENTHADPPVAETLRPYASAVVPGCVLGAVVTHFFVAPRMSDDDGQLALVGIIVATIAVLGVVLKVLIAAGLRRQVARLDEKTALDIVLEQLRRGMTANAGLVPHACVWIRRGLTPQTGAKR